MTDIEWGENGPKNPKYMKLYEDGRLLVKWDITHIDLIEDKGKLTRIEKRYKDCEVLDISQKRESPGKEEEVVGQGVDLDPSSDIKEKSPPSSPEKIKSKVNKDTPLGRFLT